jgi:nucleoside-diphosphate-sugar epimerase
VAAESSAVIHAAMDYQTDTWDLDRQIVDLVLQLGGPIRKKFIYTSGVWVYGSTGSKPANEMTSLNPPQMVSQRPEIEETILRSTAVRPLIIRPGLVYGKQGGMIGSWFAAAAANQSPVVVGNGENFWTMVHVEDLAEAYVHAIEGNLSGEVFNVTDRSRWRVRELAIAAAKAAEFFGAITFIDEDDAIEKMGPVAECLALDQHVDSRKAVRLLGWQPKHGGFVDDADVYFAAWNAAQK